LLAWPVFFGLTVILLKCSFYLSALQLGYLLNSTHSRSWIMVRQYDDMKIRFGKVFDKEWDCESEWERERVCVNQRVNEKKRSERGKEREEEQKTNKIIKISCLGRVSIMTRHNFDVTSICSTINFRRICNLILKSKSPPSLSLSLILFPLT